MKSDEIRAWTFHLGFMIVNDTQSLETDLLSWQEIKWDLTFF